MNPEFAVSSMERLVEIRNHLSRLLGLPISHFVVSFETETGDQGVIYTSPNALRVLDPKSIAEEISKRSLAAANGILKP